MDHRFVNTVLDAHYRSLDALEPDAAAAFFACCAVRLNKCVASFSAANRYQGIQTAQTRLEQIWASLRGDGLRVLNVVDGLDDLPHADDHPTFAVMAVQDFVIDVDLACETFATRRLPTREKLDFTLEVFLAKACDEATGYIDLGDSPLTPAIISSVLNQPVLAQEIAFQRADLSSLSTAVRGSPRYEELRLRALASSWQVDTIADG